MTEAPRGIEAVPGTTGRLREAFTPVEPVGIRRG